MHVVPAPPFRPARPSALGRPATVPRTATSRRLAAGGAPARLTPSPPAPPAIGELLAGCDWLRGCDADAVETLARAATVVELAARQQLGPGGRPGDRVVVLLAGRIAACHDAGTGTTACLLVAHEPLTTLGLENVLTELSWYTALAAVDEPATVLTIPAAAVHHLLLTRPQLALQVARHLALRVQGTAEQVVDLATLDVRRRVAKYLVLRLDGDGRTPRLRQHHLARRLGASRQSVNAATSSFVRRGWLSPPAADGSHRVLDRAALAACAGNPVRTGGELLH